MEKPAIEPVRAEQARLAKSLPMRDEQDFADARRGFLGALDPVVVRDAAGRVVWDNDTYAFLAGEAPATVLRGGRVRLHWAANSQMPRFLRLVPPTVVAAV